MITSVIGCMSGSICLTCISIKVTENHLEKSHIWENAALLVFIVDCLMILSVFDICICCPFCHRNIVTMYHFARNNYELPPGGRPSAQSTATNVSTL